MAHTIVYKIPLLLTPQPEGGFLVSSPALPELITEGDTLDEALAHVRDAVAAVVELYEDLKRPLPAHLQQAVDRATIALEYPVVVA